MNELIEAVGCIRKGGLVLYPTDTTYALGVDACNSTAIRLLRKFKGGRGTKPFSIMVSDEDMASRFVKLRNEDRELLRRLLPGPYTLIFHQRERVLLEVAGTQPTIAIRIPRCTRALDLVRGVGSPITATSANRSGDSPMVSPRRFLARYGELGSSKNFFKTIDGGELADNKPSTILDCTGPKVLLIRPGAGPWLPPESSDPVSRPSAPTHRSARQ